MVSTHLHPGTLLWGGGGCITQMSFSSILRNSSSIAIFHFGASDPDMASSNDGLSLTGSCAAFDSGGGPRCTTMVSWISRSGVGIGVEIGVDDSGDCVSGAIEGNVRGALRFGLWKPDGSEGKSASVGNSFSKKVQSWVWLNRLLRRSQYS